MTATVRQTVRPRIPTATYRLQFNRQFTLRDAAALVDYLFDLGISDCYASPLLAARPGSLHGYDVIDPRKLNPDLGTEEDFADFTQHLQERDMGLIVDVVPNHMCIAWSLNRWWNDVLENGPSSPHAGFFDIDWHPPKADLANKVLLPILGDQYGRVLENQEIKLAYRRGAFFVQYYETRLPVAPRTYARILDVVLAKVKATLSDGHPHRLELESIIFALSHLPPRTETDAEKVRERRREKEIVKRRLADLVSASGEVRQALQETLTEFNGFRGVPQSFDQLEALLADQAYRLCHWRVAADEINYRRFFDINELAAIRIEEPAVFTAVHELIFRWMSEGRVTGLRIDHVDGLLEPATYLRMLQREHRRALARERAPLRVARPRRTGVSEPPSGDGMACYVVVEKILGHDENLHDEWPVHGTTGYDFMNLLNGIFIEPAHEQAFRKLYKRFTGYPHNFSSQSYNSKKLILRVAMSSELHVLARRLDRISEQHRYTRDFTLNSLQYALGEVIACFPVYRSYVHRDQTEVTAEDRQHITAAIRAAKRRNPSISASIFDFIGSVLLLKDTDGLDGALRDERLEFVLRFQQLTGPVTAKGVEDTAFYRTYPLASLNEVGGDPGCFGVTVEQFHRQNEKRLARWPHSFSATSTHDTKRSEDVRARINALSEIPVRWYRAIRRWQAMNADKKISVEGDKAPHPNEEYLLYQTLVGAWPFGSMSPEAQTQFVRRIQEYMIKAIKEAKARSSWISPNEEYEQAVKDFIEAILRPDPGNQFLVDFLKFHALIARAGLYNSLSQTLLKITAPGVPDFYQGTEVWDFSLVDPDNRRPVDYAHRRKLLAALCAEETRDLPGLVTRLVENPEDGRLKLYLTSRALRFRRERRDLFDTACYRPLKVKGAQRENVIAFARIAGDCAVISAAARFFIRLGLDSKAPTCPEVWGDTSLLLEGDLAPGRYRDVLTGATVRVPNSHGASGLELAEVFSRLPVTLLERVP
jgi:(1->4)-alpha-D-glucan 1-alpha-D-glucosylmutase